MDERMITLFTFIADQVRDKQQLFDDEGTIMQALLNQGCLPHEADAALTLMQRLVQIQDEESFETEEPASAQSMRMMNREERDRFMVDAFSFITKITSLGLITEDQREEMLERALNIYYPDRITLDQVKNLIAQTLFTYSRDHEDARSDGRRIRKTAWN